MRKVSAWLFMSLDGVVEAPNEWQFDVMDDDMLGDIISQSDAEDAIIMGRVTYQDFAPFWPTSTDEPFASHINNAPKYVVSTTLDEVDWGNWDDQRKSRQRNQQTEAAIWKEHWGEWQPYTRPVPAPGGPARRA